MERIVKGTYTLPKKGGRGKSPGTQAALAKYKWKKGQSGNPKGVCPPQTNQGRGSLIAHQLKHFMSLQCPKAIKAKLRAKFPQIDVDELTSGEAIWLGVVADAQKGNGYSREFIAERTEGKVPSAVDLTSKGERINQSTYTVISTEQAKQIETFHNTTDDI